MQSQPHVGHVVRYVPDGTTLLVSCQTVHGDQVDGRVRNGKPFTTWDRLTDGTWVYDWYMNTPAVGADGYSPASPTARVAGLPVGETPGRIPAGRQG
ncbi:MAG: hypothetical protein ACJ72W_24010 [Actinoallomurus sp.]